MLAQWLILRSDLPIPETEYDNFESFKSTWLTNLDVTKFNCEAESNTARHGMKEPVLFLTNMTAVAISTLSVRGGSGGILLDFDTSVVV